MRPAGTPSAAPADTPSARPRIEVELLALDLSSCGRCTATSDNLDAALAAVAGVLEAADVDVGVRRTVVRTAEEAERLRFVSSPTIRVNGRDVALELRESACGDCAELCGCGDGIECRDWVWRGETHREAPKGMIVEALLRAAAGVHGGGGAAAPAGPEPYRMPENLGRFFAAPGRSSSCAPDADCGSGPGGACCEGAAPAAAPCCAR